MLPLLILSLFYNTLYASSSCPSGHPSGALLPQACEANPEILKEVHSFQKEFTQKRNGLLESTQFQKIVSELQNPIPQSLKKEETYQQGQLFVFVSFSLGEKALLNLALDAKHYGATLVLRGFKNGNLRQTVNSLHKIILKTGRGVMIDPELFTLFNITAVPTFVLAKQIPLHALERNQTPLHDRLQGHVGLRYVLEAFAKEGDLKTEAKSLLAKGAL